MRQIIRLGQCQRGFLWYNSDVDLLTTSIASGVSGGEAFTLVRLSGEADVTNIAALRDVLEAQVPGDSRTLVIDLSDLRFMDSSALHVILRVNRAMDRQGRVVALAAPRDAVAKMLRLTAADQLIPVYASVDEATAG